MTKNPGSIAINDNIVCQLDKCTTNLFKKGILKTDGEEKVSNYWCDDTINSITEDENQKKLFAKDGSYTDFDKGSDIKTRYR